EVFDVPQAALRVWDVADSYRDAHFARQVGEEVRLFANGLDAPYCGANTGFEAAQWLTAGDYASVASVGDGPAAVADANGAVQSIALLALREPRLNDDSPARGTEESGAPAASDAPPPPPAPAFGLLVMGSP